MCVDGKVCRYQYVCRFKLCITSLKAVPHVTFSSLFDLTIGKRYHKYPPTHEKNEYSGIGGTSEEEEEEEEEEGEEEEEEEEGGGGEEGEGEGGNSSSSSMGESLMEGEGGGEEGVDSTIPAMTWGKEKE